MSSSLRLQSVTISSQENVSRVFVRVTRTPIRIAVAIALDLSESCSDTSEILARLHKLFLKTRLDTPLWLFRLSDRTPISDVAVDKVEHLVHGSISLLSHMSNREKNVDAAYSGTLLRPVIETIKQLQNTNRIAKISLVVVTDGELLDRQALTIPESIEVIGIQSKSTIPQNWIRVLGPAVPLYSWDDPKLTYQSLFPNEPSVLYLSAIEKQGTTGTNSAELHSFSSLTKIKILQRISATSRIETQDRVKIGEIDTEVDFVLESSSPIPIETALIVHDGSDQLIDTFVLSKLERIDPRLIPNVFLGNNEVEKPSGFWNTLLDYSPLESGQDLAQAWYTFFESMAKYRKNWLVEKDFAELQSHFIGAESEVTSRDALIAMVELEATGQVLRVIIFGLSESAKPAICWGKNVSVPWGVAEQEFSMHYDRLEARWILLTGQIQLSLFPKVSQKIELKILSGPRWHFYFSGRIQS